MITDGSLDRCSTCILPRSARLVGFDADGRCTLCVAAGQRSAILQEDSKADHDLEAVIDHVRERGKGHPFDCVVGVSGGRDSSYLLYLLVHKHQLRCLAAYYRTPFTVDIIDASVRRLTGRLGVPLAEMEISQDYHRRVARELVLLWDKDPQMIIPNLACAPCKQVNRELYEVAMANDVPTILAGANVFEAVQIAAGQQSNRTLLPGRAAARNLGLGAQMKKMLRLVKKGAGVLKSSSRLWQYIPLGIKASVMYISPHTPFLRFRYPNIQAVEYFYHADWDEYDCQNALAEIGWEMPSGYPSTWKADCTFAELKNYMFRQMTSMTYMDAFYSNMIRAGVITREEAIRRIAVEGRPSEERLEHASKVLGLPDNFYCSER